MEAVEVGLDSGLDAGTAYSNIHNATFPGGEIRGNLAAVPEPSWSPAIKPQPAGDHNHARRSEGFLETYQLLMPEPIGESCEREYRLSDQQDRLLYESNGPHRDLLEVQPLGFRGP